MTPSSCSSFLFARLPQASYREGALKGTTPKAVKRRALKGHNSLESAEISQMSCPPNRSSRKNVLVLCHGWDYIWLLVRVYQQPIASGLAVALKEQRGFVLELFERLLTLSLKFALSIWPQIPREASDCTFRCHSLQQLRSLQSESAKRTNLDGPNASDNLLPALAHLFLKSSIGALHLIDGLFGANVIGPAQGEIIFPQAAFTAFPSKLELGKLKGTEPPVGNAPFKDVYGRKGKLENLVVLQPLPLKFLFYKRNGNALVEELRSDNKSRNTAIYITIVKTTLESDAQPTKFPKAKTVKCCRTDEAPDRFSKLLVGQCLRNFKRGRKASITLERSLLLTYSCERLKTFNCLNNWKEKSGRGPEEMALVCNVKMARQFRAIQ
nr:hypothetical protein Iba_chr01fCG9290 [Ipomoea batatas]